MCIEDKVVCKWYQPHRWGRWKTCREGRSIIQKRTCSRCGKAECNILLQIGEQNEVH